jgi:hypothetical protein
MRRAFAALLAAVALAACSTRPETLPNPYVSLSQAPIRTIGLAAGSSPFAAAVAAALHERGFRMRELPDHVIHAATLSGAYPDYGALRGLQADGIDGLLTVRAARGGTGAMDGEDAAEFLDRANAANAAVTATADGAVVASADWRPRLGWHVGPTPTRAAAGPLLQSDFLAPPAQQLAEALAAQILR